MAIKDPSTYASALNLYNDFLFANTLTFKFKIHPGVTGFLNLAFSIPVKKTRLLVDRDLSEYETKQAYFYS